MRPNKTGQIVKFHTHLPDENPNQIYVVLEILEDNIRPRATIHALNTGLAFPPINTVSLNDLEVVEVESSDMIGHHVTINKSDYSKTTGKVISVQDQKISLNLSNRISGVETNVWITIEDENGIEHTGTLFVN
jgi:transcription antitermination factor NusG